MALDAPRAAMLLDPREGMILAQQDEGEAFVVAQQDVVGRPEALDQLRLEQQRLGLGPRRDDRHRPGLGDHPLQPLRQARYLRIVADPAFERARLADIEDVAPRILHAIDAGPRRERLPHLTNGGDACLEVGRIRPAHRIGRLLLVEALGGSGMIGTVGLAHEGDLGISAKACEGIWPAS